MVLPPAESAARALRTTSRSVKCFTRDRHIRTALRAGAVHPVAFSPAVDSPHCERGALPAHRACIWVSCAVAQNGLVGPHLARGETAQERISDKRAGRQRRKHTVSAVRALRAWLQGADVARRHLDDVAKDIPVPARACAGGKIWRAQEGKSGRACATQRQGETSVNGFGVSEEAEHVPCSTRAATSIAPQSPPNRKDAGRGPPWREFARLERDL
ncbi:hypothetical protein FA95DRAFT_853903 [Auriscalpium vulgare]|uniref:Uncharacterized protein n=1 Tax=Auriscalpium vulgare TaxID=40419 RepID=A0ACB8R985_9AGAM|nr:hypothetical protein FA95DRAFT_853903 [Auriscalpium vulgare]